MSSWTRDRCRLYSSEACRESTAPSPSAWQYESCLIFCAINRQQFLGCWTTDKRLSQRRISYGLIEDVEYDKNNQNTRHCDGLGWLLGKRRFSFKYFCLSGERKLFIGDTLLYFGLGRFMWRWRFEKHYIVKIRESRSRHPGWQNFGGGIFNLIIIYY